MNSTDMIVAGMGEAVYHAAGIETVWDAQGDVRPSRSLSKKAAQLDPTGALLSESQWAGVVVMLLHEGGTHVPGSTIAQNRDWLWTARETGIEPSDVANWLRGKAE